MRKVKQMILNSKKKEALVPSKTRSISQQRVKELLDEMLEKYPDLWETFYDGK